MALLVEEKYARMHLEKLPANEESMYKRRSRGPHVNLGDNNTRYFYGLLKSRHSKSYLSEINGREGKTFSNPSIIAQVWVSHFQTLLSPNIEWNDHDLSHISLKS